MKIMGIDKEAVKEAAARAFPRKHAQIENGSLFLPGCADGTYRCDHMEELLHVSTCMGYHEVMIQGNQTRVKIEITLVFLKDGPYEVIYERSAAMSQWKRTGRSAFCHTRRFWNRS